MAEVTFGGAAMPLAGKTVDVGDKAADFTAVGPDLKPVSLSDYKGKIRIISVYPSIDTSVCSLQTQRFNREAGNLGEDVVIISISNDLPFALGRYCAAEGVKNLVVVSDHKDLDFGMKYGFVLEPLRLLTRGVVVVDAQDQVSYVEYVPEVTHEPNYEAALKAVAELRK